MERDDAHDVDRLLTPLTERQSRMIGLIATTFVEEAGQWPVFDYLEAEFDRDDIDAAAVLASLPRDVSGQYAAAWWPRTSSNDRPLPDARVALTVLGIHHSGKIVDGTANLADAFFAVLSYMIDCRRSAPRSRVSPTTVKISSDEVLATLAERGFSFEGLPARFLYDLMEHEPGTWGAGGSASDDGWTRNVPRTVLRFAGVQAMNQYLERTLALLAPYAPRARPVTPSPFGLVATIDYLDTVWRLVNGHDHLFRLHSAQKTAQLANPVGDVDEFESRLSGLAEILRSAQVPKSGVRRKERDRDRVLVSFETYLVGLLPGSQTRIKRSITTLQNVLDVRDAAQHSAAGMRAQAAFEALGVAYPPAAWALAWEVVVARTIEALTALREEIGTLVA